MSGAGLIVTQGEWIIMYQHHQSQWLHFSDHEDNAFGQNSIAHLETTIKERLVSRIKSHSSVTNNILISCGA